MEEMSYLLLFTFFHSLIFTLVAARISHFLTAAKFVLPTNSSLSSALALCRSFSRWASLAFRPLYFFSIFQICGHDNWSKLNTLDNKDTQTISAFVFIDSLVFSASQDAGGYAISHQNNLELPYLLVELF